MQKSSKIKNRIFPAFDDIKSQDEFPYFFDQKNKSSQKSFKLFFLSKTQKIDDFKGTY